MTQPTVADVARATHLRLSDKVLYTVPDNREYRVFHGALGPIVKATMKAVGTPAGYANENSVMRTVMGHLSQSGNVICVRRGVPPSYHVRVSYATDPAEVKTAPVPAPTGRRRTPAVGQGVSNLQDTGRTFLKHLTRTRPKTAVEIATQIGMTTTGAAGIVGRLVDRGLATQVDNRQRGGRFILTPEGSAIKAQLCAPTPTAPSEPEFTSAPEPLADAVSETLDGVSMTLRGMSDTDLLRRLERVALEDEAARRGLL